jgi:hypothetical protein
MMTWMDLPTSQLGTCSTISSPPTATSPRWILKTTLNTCAWDPQQPAESLFNQIQDCADYSEAGGVLIGHPQQINVGYAKIFATGYFMSACLRWNEKPLADKTWEQFKSHFSAAHRQHKQMKGESAATAGYHSANAAVGQTDDQNG